jgi:hypothetical protein
LSTHDSSDSPAWAKSLCRLGNAMLTMNRSRREAKTPIEIRKRFARAGRS